MRYLFFFILLSITSPLIAQEELQYKDHVYTDYIKSVKIHHRGLFTSMPIIDLNSSGKLTLSFDDMDGGEREYRYYLIHCDQNWQPTDLEDIEYLDGFNGEEILDINYSNGTFVDYTHYRLSFPNRDVQPRFSGNYIIAIYDETDEKELCITRRFMVVDSKVTVQAEMRKPTVARKYRTHQEIDFDILVKNFKLADPLGEIKVKVLQNGRWDSALHDLTPKFVNRDKLVFNYVDVINFPAYNEFRFADVRSTKFVPPGVHSVDITPESTDVLLEMDGFREYNNFTNYSDINGNFVIETRDQEFNLNLADRSVSFSGSQNVLVDNQVKSDYVNVIFTLDLGGPELDNQVYIIGGLTDWEIKPDFQMRYDFKREIYVCQVLLKQGFYDYYYTYKNDEGIDIEPIEGSWFETENEYTMLVYYSPFGGDYDQLISVGHINSVRF